VIYVVGIDNYRKNCDQVADQQYEGFAFEIAYRGVVKMGAQ